MEERLQNEIHDMSEKIFALQAKTEHLTNGQRYAAINEIEKPSFLIPSCPTMLLLTILQSPV